MDIRWKLSYFLLFSIHVFYGMQEKEKFFFAHEKRQRNPLSSLLVTQERFELPTP